MCTAARILAACEDFSLSASSLNHSFSIHSLSTLQSICRTAKRISRWRLRLVVVDLQTLVACHVDVAHADRAVGKLQVARHRIVAVGLHRAKGFNAGGSPPRAGCQQARQKTIAANACNSGHERNRTTAFSSYAVDQSFAATRRPRCSQAPAWRALVEKHEHCLSTTPITPLLTETQNFCSRGSLTDRAKRTPRMPARPDATARAVTIFDGDPPACRPFGLRQPIANAFLATICPSGKLDSGTPFPTQYIIDASARDGADLVAWGSAAYRR